MAYIETRYLIACFLIPFVCSSLSFLSLLLSSLLFSSYFSFLINLVSFYSAKTADNVQNLFVDLTKKSLVYINERSYLYPYRNKTKNKKEERRKKKEERRKKKEERRNKNKKQFFDVFPRQAARRRGRSQREDCFQARMCNSKRHQSMISTPFCFCFYFCFNCL